jgi:hypothetical protein
MILDLRFNARIDPRVTPFLDHLSFSNRVSFNKFTESFTRPLIDNIDWWAENPASRNTYSSPLFHYFCSIHLVVNLIEDKIFNIDTIIVDSKIMKDLLSKICKQHKAENIVVSYKPGLKIRVKRLLKHWVYYEWEFIKRLIQLFIVRLTMKASNFDLKNLDITLIDTFMMKDYISNDRWYGTFWEDLDSNIKAEIFFVPTVVNTSIIDFRFVANAMRHSERNFILKEDFLKARDLLFAYLHKRRVIDIPLGSFNLYGLELRDLVTEDIENNRDVSTIIEALITYRFISRISEHGLRIRHSIDWFEGHSLDKLWNLAIKRFYPAVKRIGYETFRSFPYYLSTFPIHIEREAGTIPDIIAVQGNSCIESVKEFLSTQEVIVIPAFKYHHVWEYNYPEDNNYHAQILITLPMSMEASIRMIHLLIDSFNNFDNLLDQSIEFIIKPHPVHNIASIKKKITQEFPSSFSFTNEKSFPKLLMSSSILVTEASSTCLEAFAYGIPVIIIENPTGLTYDPVPKDISQDLFLKCKIAEDFSNAIFHFLSYTSMQKKKNQKRGSEIRERYFEKVTKKGIDAFLGITNNSNKC